MCCLELDSYSIIHSSICFRAQKNVIQVCNNVREKLTFLFLSEVFFKFLLNIQTLNSFKRESEKSSHLITSVLQQVQHLHLRSCWDSQLLSSNYKDIILQRYKRSIVHCRWLQNICRFSTKPPASGTQHWFASERWFMVKALELI